MLNEHAKSVGFLFILCFYFFFFSLQYICAFLDLCGLLSYFCLFSSLTSHTPDLYTVPVPYVVSRPSECVCRSVCLESFSKTPSSWTKGELLSRNHCKRKKTYFN